MLLARIAEEVTGASCRALVSGSTSLGPSDWGEHVRCRSRSRISPILPQHRPHARRTGAPREMRAHYHRLGLAWRRRVNRVRPGSLPRRALRRRVAVATVSRVDDRVGRGALSSGRVVRGTMPIGITEDRVTDLDSWLISFTVGIDRGAQRRRSMLQRQRVPRVRSRGASVCVNGSDPEEGFNAEELVFDILDYPGVVSDAGQERSDAPMTAPQLQSTISCPPCGQQEGDEHVDKRMPLLSRVRWVSGMLRRGSCCVFCSYGGARRARQCRAGGGGAAASP